MVPLFREVWERIKKALGSSRTGLLKLWPLLIPLLIYVPGMGGRIPFPSSQSQFTDVLISHYPNALFVKDTLLDLHSIPLWSPLILGGYPFFANPLSGLWYPFGWLALIFSLPAGFSYTVALHAIWGGVGLYYLLRGEGVKHGPALIGALAFEALPKISAHFGAGHITLVYAVYWTPWLLLASRSQRRVPLSALAMAAIFLADPRWSVYSGLLWLFYFLAYSHDRFRRQAMDILKVLFYAFLVSAVLAVPMLEYIPRTTRWEMAVSEILTKSLAPAELIGGLFPSGGRSPESAFYVGGVILILAVFGLSRLNIRKKARVWVWAALLSGILALGSNIPGMTLAARLPGFSLLRVPARSLFVFSLSMIVIAAHSLAVLTNPRPRQQLRIPFITVSLFLILLLAGVGFAVNSFTIELLWGGTAMALGLGVIVLFAKMEDFSPSGFLSVIAILVMADTVGSAFLNIDYRSPDRLEPGMKVGWLTDKIHQTGHYRIYSPSYSIPQAHGSRYQFEMVDGVDPLQLDAYVRFMETATGIPQQGYSVTVPPFQGSPNQSNKGIVPDPARLGLLNVKYIVSEFRISHPSFLEVYEADQGFIYRNEQALPRAWIQPWAEEREPADLVKRKDQLRSANIIRWEPNQIKLRAEGPGYLVLSEMAYPGWQVTVDGDPGEMGTPYNLLRGVKLEEGVHTVKFIFRPRSLYIGVTLSVIGLGLCIRELRNDH